jgi:dienelactone hydrolase
VTVSDLKAAMDWAERENSRAASPLYGKIETRQVAVMGQSCGGFLAITLGADPRVSTIGVFNAGVQEPNWLAWLDPMPSAPPAAALKSLHGPVLLLNGGDPDFMKGPSRAAYEAIEAQPVFYGSRHGAGHLATVLYPGGGEFANVASSWALWQLKHDAQAGALFVGSGWGLCTRADWDVASKHLAN